MRPDGDEPNNGLITVEVAVRPRNSDQPETACTSFASSLMEQRATDAPDLRPDWRIDAPDARGGGQGRYKRIIARVIDRWVDNGVAVRRNATTPRAAYCFADTSPFAITW